MFRIGRYEVTGTLGEGGMGIVYSARDPQLGRLLAIKTLHAASRDPVARERLTREARTAAAINHPSVCQLYEIGDHEGELYLAMELLEGESLAVRIARGSLTVSEAVSIALGILVGVEALHRHSVVHRDLKPSNVFLTPYGVKLLDFGVAVASSSDPSSTMTKLATLPGQIPFTGRTTVEVFHSVLYDEPPVLTGGPAVAAVDRVIRRAVAKKREDRFQSAEAFAQELRSALLLADTQPVAARTITRLIVLPLRVLRPDPETDFLAFSLADAVGSGALLAQRAGARWRPLHAPGRADDEDRRCAVASADRSRAEDASSRRALDASCVRTLPARERVEPRYHTVEDGAIALPRMPRGGSALRAGLGRPGPNPSGDQQVHGRGSCEHDGAVGDGAQACTRAQSRSVERGECVRLPRGRSGPGTDAMSRLIRLARTRSSDPEGDPERSIAAMDPLRGILDPEARYFVGRHLASAGDRDGALNAIEWPVDNGFFCVPAMARDPWLDSLRGNPTFAAIMRRAEARHREAVVTFLTAQGDRVLGLAQPA